MSARYPNAPDVLVFQGLKAYYVDHDPVKAQRQFKAAADRDSAHVEAHFLAAGRDIDLAYVALSQGDIESAKTAIADAHRLIDHATAQVPFATALPRYAIQVGALNELAGNDTGAYAVYEKLVSVDPQSALSAAFVSWRLPDPDAVRNRSLEGLEEGMRQIQKGSNSAEGWSFRVSGTDLVDLHPKDEKVCLLAWAYDLTSRLQQPADGERRATHSDFVAVPASCREGAVAARTREVVCVQVLNAQHALPQLDSRQLLLENSRLNDLRCQPDLQPLPILKSPGG